MRWIPASILIASIAFATVPYTFPAGIPAKAAQVNRNFEALDSLVNAQVERLAEVREMLVHQSDSLRKEISEIKRKAKGDSAVPATHVGQASVADTSWKLAILPKGSLIGSIVPAGADGFLPGSDNSWQSVEAYGFIDGLPLPSIAAPVVPKVDSLAVQVPVDSLQPVPVAVPVAAKPVLHWFVKVK